MNECTCAVVVNYYFRHEYHKKTKAKEIIQRHHYILLRHNHLNHSVGFVQEN
jgi:hypothetical protein